MHGLIASFGVFNLSTKALEDDVGPCALPLACATNIDTLEIAYSHRDL